MILGVRQCILWDFNEVRDEFVIQLKYIQSEDLLDPN